METNDHNKVILINGEAERRRNRRRRKGLGILSCNSDEDYDHEVKGMILDPTLPILNKWNRVFLVASLVSLFVDPIFFFLPVVNAEDGCIQMSAELGVALTVVRSMADVFYVAHILIRFRTAYVAPSSRIFGRGDLVIHPSKIAANYLGCEFWLHFAAALPLPQVNSLLLCIHYKNIVILSEVVDSIYIIIPNLTQTFQNSILRRV